MRAPRSSAHAQYTHTQHTAHTAARTHARAVHTLPDVTFTVGGIDYSVPPQLWTQKACAAPPAFGTRARVAGAACIALHCLFLHCKPAHINHATLPPACCDPPPRSGPQMPQPPGMAIPDEFLCISAILPGGNSSTVILGNNFLRAFYTAYRLDAATGACVRVCVYVGGGACVACVSQVPPAAQHMNTHAHAHVQPHAYAYVHAPHTYICAHTPSHTHTHT